MSARDSNWFWIKRTASVGEGNLGPETQIEAGLLSVAKGRGSMSKPDPSLFEGAAAGGDLCNHRKFVPVIGKFLAAFEAYDVGPSLPCCGWTTLSWFDRERKAEPPMPAAKQEIGNAQFYSHRHDICRPMLRACTAGNSILSSSSLYL